MHRYLLTLGRFWHASVAAELEYRVNFAAAALSSVMTLGGSLFTLSLLFQHGYEPGGWSWSKALLVVGLFSVLEGLQSAVMSPNRMLISEQVREGTLDFVLMKPMDAQWWLSVRRLSVWGVPNVVLGLFIAGYALWLHEPAVRGVDVLAGVGMLCVGLAMLYCLGFVLATTSIWFIKLFNITIAMSALLEAGRYPIPAYPWAYQVLFTFVLPVAFMTSVPAEAMTGGLGWGWALGGVLMSAALFGVTRWFWGFALRSYSSASS